MGSTFYPFLPYAYNVDVGCDGWSSRSHLGPEENLRMEATMEKQRTGPWLLLNSWFHLNSTSLATSRFLKYSHKRNLLV